MAVNPMQRKARNSFLLGMIITLLITGIIIVLLFLQLKKVQEEQAAELASRVNVYVLNQNVKSGQILTEDMFIMKSINRDTIPSNATSIPDVIASWYLQTVDGNTVARDAQGLYINVVDTIIELYLDNGQYYKKSNDESVSLRSDPLSADVNGETIYFAMSNNAEDDVTRVYEDLNTGNCYIYKIENGTLVKEYIEFNTVPLLAKVNMNANTVITRDFVVQSDTVITDDVRRQEYNMIGLPIDLMTDDYVDIRLMMPNGQDFIVISKKQVEVPMNADGSYASDTIWLNLDEGEILAMSSAIVEAYGVQGAKLYATKYVEPGMQNSSTATYYPNNAVIEQINSNPNIVDLARQELRKRYTENARLLRENFLQSEINEEITYDNNVVTGMDAGITNSEAARKKYLESLGY